MTSPSFSESPVGSQSKYFLCIGLLWSYLYCVEIAYFVASWLQWSQKSPKQTWRLHLPERIITDFQRHRQGWEPEATAHREWKGSLLLLPLLHPLSQENGCLTQTKDPTAEARFCLSETLSSSYQWSLSVLPNHRLEEHWKVVDPCLVQPLPWGQCQLHNHSEINRLIRTATLSWLYSSLLTADLIYLCTYLRQRLV